MPELIIPEINLTSNGFTKGVGPNYYYPIGDNNYHIHIGAPTGLGIPADSVRVDFIAIKNVPAVKHGQNLRQNPLTGLFDLDTPGINWGTNEADFKNRLILAGVAYFSGAQPNTIVKTLGDTSLASDRTTILAGGAAAPSIVPGPDLVSMAQAFTGLPMNDLIGAPLMAAAKANNQMAITQTKYILDTGFQQDTSSGDTTYKPIMIDMELTRPVIVPPATPGDEPTISEITSTVKVPLLTIMPINSLAVDEVDISFDMEVKSSYGQTTSAETEKAMAAEASFEAKVGFGFFSASVKGSVSSSSKSSTSDTKTFNKSNSATYHVQVHAGQQETPPGLTALLTEFSKNLGPIELPAPSK